MHLSQKKMKEAATKSLRRLGLKYLDLYLIHWPSPLRSIEKQIKVMESLVKEEKTRYIGLSNFSVEQFKEAQNHIDVDIVTNQLLANLNKQNHIHESLPYYQESGVTLTAYSPLGHRGFNNLNEKLKERLEQIALKHKATIQQIAIAWLINHKNTITIPKAFNIEHVEANAQAAEITLSEEEIKLLYN
jgi:diketogulonate reductase-like aldo/keto reductase